MVEGRAEKERELVTKMMKKGKSEAEIIEDLDITTERFYDIKDSLGA